MRSPYESFVRKGGYEIKGVDNPEKVRAGGGAWGSIKDDVIFPPASAEDEPGPGPHPAAPRAGHGTAARAGTHAAVSGLGNEHRMQGAAGQLVPPLST